MTVGERIRYLRKDTLKLTLDQFGERIGLKKSALSHIENDNVKLTDQTCRSICREFNISEEWLLTGEGDVFLAESRSAEIAKFVNTLSVNDDTFKTRLVVMLARMTPAEWDLLERMVRKLTDLEDEDVAPVQLEGSPAETAEDAYIKRRSSDAQTTEQSASNTTDGIA